MDKNNVISRLLKHRSELEAEGARHISIFGSVARGENDEQSDLDIVVELTDEVRRSGFGYFGALTALREKIAHITGQRVDILSEPIESDRLRREVERDRAFAF